MTVKWRFGILAGLIVAVFALYPQFALVNERAMNAKNWNGTFASNDLDEVAYAAYLQALIDGRPRKNDPYSGRDQSADAPQPESIFSIQFLPPAILSVPARAFGLDASQTFICLSALAGFLTALALFWFLAQITGDNRFAFVGVLLILFGGALAAGNGAIAEFTGRGAAYPFFPFLRRYIPAAAFPFFFALFGFVWRALKSESRNAKYIASTCAALSFTVLVFSYFYLWTTAAAFLFALTVLWIILRPENWKTDLRALVLIDFLCFLSLLPYAFLLSRRAPDIDSIQLLVLTHAPDLLRFCAVVCYAAIILIALAVVLKFAKLKNARTIFPLAFALVPFIVFNQQIVSGRSLQPFHYEYYVVNYISALTIVLVVFLFLRRISAPKIYTAILMFLGFAAVAWGFTEAKLTTRVLMFWNVEREESLPVTKRLEQIAAAENLPDAKSQVTLNLDYVQADNQPLYAPFAVLWARHQHVFAGVSWEENKERFYKMLYYADRDADWLRKDFKRGDIEAYMALFGWDRFNATLSVNSRPLTTAEIEAEVARYDDYYKNFNTEQATRPALSFVVAPNDSQPEFENLKRWYETDAGETIGKFTLYRVKLK